MAISPAPAPSLGNTFATLWNEPRAPDAPARVWRDWLLLAVFVPLMVVEAVRSPPPVWPGITLAVGIALVVALLWRRTRPLAVVCAAFAAAPSLELLGLLQGVAWDGLDAYACLLVLPYALVRWGSGREVIAGALVIAASFGVQMSIDGHPWGEIAGASLFLLFPAALGASVRYQDRARRREREQVRLRERTELARELHDSVAHHVSAIAVQAQAGRALAAARPEAAAQALAAIEEAASRSLDEMRGMVGALRDGAGAERGPLPGLADIERLAREQATALAIHVSREGDLSRLGPSLEVTLFRVAREAITNAVRHARGARKVDVRIAAEDDRVLLSVEDDGTAAPVASAGGFGLRGMTERVELLGGTLHAGPAPTVGWRVRAVLPRESPR